MKEKTIWHPASEFPESGAYVLVVYNGRLREQTVNQKIMADFFETSHGDHYGKDIYALIPKPEGFH